MEIDIIKTDEEKFRVKAVRCIGYPDYIVYNCGMIWSNKTKKFLTPNKLKKGYLVVGLRKPNAKRGETDKFLLSRLVAKHFNPNPKKLPQVNHGDGNKLNNWWWNLIWSTAKENIQHAFRTGLGRKCQPKLDKKTRALMIEEYNLGWNKKALARKYKVSTPTILKYIRAWK